ncbi:MAG TPA: Rab family GTPase [Candidatus Lokiarchaeia archaeon]|nr:Rab family GTPase [Candidatus Lokiarchaeia archaeon]
MAGTNYSWKIMVGGAGGVGKTTLLHRFLHDSFIADTSLTVGVAFQSKEIIRNGSRILLALWDLGGQDRFRFMQPSYCTGGKAGIVFFDMTRLDTVLQVKDWVSMFRKHASANIPIILGGTKLDLVDTDMLDSANEYAKELVDQLGLSYYITTSSKTGENVDEIFNYVVETLLAQINQGNYTAASSSE